MNWKSKLSNLNQILKSLTESWLPGIYNINQRKGKSPESIWHSKPLSPLFPLQDTTFLRFRKKTSGKTLFLMSEIDNLSATCCHRHLCPCSSLTYYKFLSINVRHLPCTVQENNFPQKKCALINISWNQWILVKNFLGFIR